jgi:hypothetical protein
LAGPGYDGGKIMKKKVVIFVGKHYVGKSKTIREYLTVLLKVEHDDHKFWLREKAGYILSQSFEEAKRDVVSTIKKYSDYDLLVLAARPESEPGSKLNELQKVLAKKSYSVRLIIIEKGDDLKERARAAFNFLKQQ